MGKDIKRRISHFKNIKSIDRADKILHKNKVFNIKNKQRIQENIHKKRQDNTISNESHATDEMVYGSREVVYQEVASAKNIKDKVSKLKKSRAKKAHILQEESEIEYPVSKSRFSDDSVPSIRKIGAMDHAEKSHDNIVKSKTKTKDNHRAISKRNSKVPSKRSDSIEYRTSDRNVTASKIKTRDSLKDYPRKYISPKAVNANPTVLPPTPNVKAKNNSNEKNLLKRVINSFKSTAKTAVKTFKSMTTLLSLGASTFVFIIIIICTASIIISSPFSIFFSNDSATEDTSLQNAITIVNKKYNQKVHEVREQYDSIDQSVTIINGDRKLKLHDVWKDVLLVYTIRTYNQERGSLYFDEQRIKQLEDVFFQTVLIEGKLETKNEKRILNIHVKVKTQDELAFTTEEEKIRSDLLDGKNDYLWNNILDGISIANGSIVETALSQLGNIGGEPFWSWYGFTSRVEWCACFVSWVADQNGYIEADIIPKFASVHNEGMPWFKNNNQWENGGYQPVAGDIIFFDWDGDNHGDHVGIVENYNEGIVYTIEGNSIDDECRQRDYPVDSPYILGYGIPIY